MVRGASLIARPTTEVAAAVEVTDVCKAFRLPHQQRTTLKEHFLHPFDQTAHLCKMGWARPFVVHGSAVQTEADLVREAGRYADYLRGPL